MPKKVDLTGQKFDRLTVLQETGKKDRSGNLYWLCQCDCGEEREVRGRNLRNGDCKSCGCLMKETRPVAEVPVGERYGRLTVCGRDVEQEPRSYRAVMWQCICDCGNHITARAQSIRRGTTQSCGCLNIDTEKRRNDLVGQISGQYLVLKYSHTKHQKAGYKEAYWLVKCLKCGTNVIKSSRSIKHYQSQSCKGHLGSHTKKYRRVKQALRNRRVRQATPKWADFEQIEKIYRQCNPGFAVDHIVPLRGKRVCGLHVENNLRIVPVSLNVRKKNHFTEEDEVVLLSIPAQAWSEFYREGHATFPED